MSATSANRYRSWILAALAVAVLAAGVFIIGWRELIGSLPFMSEARVTLVGNAFRPMLIAAVLYSIPLAVVAFIIGLIIALLVALVRVVPATGIAHRLLLAVVHAYVSAIRGTPMLVQLMIVFYGLPAVGITLDPRPTAIIGCSLNVGAYASETVRAAILSVPRGQWEAGFTIGMTYLQTFRRIILPQALRVSVPPLSNSFIGLFKETSLASTVTITELFRAAQQIANANYDFLPVYIEAALVYWIFCFGLSLAQSRLERRLDRYIAK